MEPLSSMLCFLKVSAYRICLCAVLILSMLITTNWFFFSQLTGMSSSIKRWWTTEDSWCLVATLFQCRWCTAQVGGDSPVRMFRKKIWEKYIFVQKHSLRTIYEPLVPLSVWIYVKYTRDPVKLELSVLQDNRFYFLLFIQYFFLFSGL